MALNQPLVPGPLLDSGAFRLGNPCTPISLLAAPSPPTLFPQMVFPGAGVYL